MWTGAGFTWALSLYIAGNNLCKPIRVKLADKFAQSGEEKIVQNN